MMNLKFLQDNKTIITVMTQADTPERIEELVKKALPEGAEAFGMQFCKLKKNYRNKDIYKRLFSCTKGKPVYVTNYRICENENKTDDQLAEELKELSECGAGLCDVMGDIFDKSPEELTMNQKAVEKQMRLIEEIHSRGSEVLMSSHVLKFTKAERVLEIALEHQKRGADICKIVTGAETMEQQIENLRIVNLLKENLQIPFLFLSSGQCRILRRIGGGLGCCMYLCVYEYDDFSTPEQPLLRHVKMIRDNFDL